MKTKFYFNIVLVIFIFLIWNNSMANCNAENGKLEKDYSFIQTYSVTSPLTLSVSTTGGNIIQEGRDGNTAEIAFIVSSHGKIIDIPYDQLKNYADVEIVNTNASLFITVKKIYDRKVSIGFSIKTPVQTSSNLTTSGGNIELNELNGTQYIRTSGGNLTFGKLSGKIDASTSGGNISIVNSAANCNVSTSGGNITMENETGNVKVSTSGGNIEGNNLPKGLTGNTSGGNILLNNVQEWIDINTSGGNIEMSDVSGSIRAITSGGEIKATIRHLTEKLDMETSGGNIDAIIPSQLGYDLDLSAELIQVPLVNFTGTKKINKVEGQMNGGGIKVKLSTSAGTLQLQFK